MSVNSKLYTKEETLREISRYANHLRTHLYELTDEQGNELLNCLRTLMNIHNNVKSK